MLYVPGMGGTLCKGGTNALIIYKENQVSILESRLECVKQSDGCNQFQRDNLRVPWSLTENDLCRCVHRTRSVVRLLEDTAPQASTRQGGGMKCRPFSIGICNHRGRVHYPKPIYVWLDERDDVEEEIHAN